MKLSIIIPVYNVELYIESCLLSVLNQIHMNDTEVILVDDCGTDNSMNIVERIVKEYSDHTNISIISHTQNRGLSAARNTGVKHAKGDYIFFLDSDDELSQNTINIFNRYLEQYGYADFYIGNYIVDGPFNAIMLNNAKIEYNNNDDIFNAYINNEWYVMACGKFINRKFFINNSLWFPVGRLHEDEYFSFLLALKANKMIVMNEYIYIYKIRENSITNSKNRKNFIDFVWIIEQKIAIIIKHKLPINKRLYNHITWMLFSLIVSVSFSTLKYNEQYTLLSWSRKQLRIAKVQIKQKDYSLKSIIKTILIETPPVISIQLLKLYCFRNIIKR